MQPPATAWTPEPSGGAEFSGPAGRGRRIGRPVVLGTVLLALLVSYAGGWRRFWRGFRILGWAAPLILVPYIVINVPADTSGLAMYPPRQGPANCNPSLLPLPRAHGGRGGENSK